MTTITYITMYNGGNYYTVNIDDKNFSVNLGEDKVLPNQPYIGYFIDRASFPIGNSILIEIDKNTYVIQVNSDLYKYMLIYCNNKCDYSEHPFPMNVN